MRVLQVGLGRRVWSRHAGGHVFARPSGPYGVLPAPGEPRQDGRVRLSAELASAAAAGEGARGT
jgi:hypothetical protein